MTIIKLEDNHEILDQVAQIEHQYDYYEGINSTIEKVIERIIDRVESDYSHWIELEGETPQGFTYGHPGYRESFKGSGVYVPKEYERRGIGKALVQTQIDYARALGYRVICGNIDLDNQASIALHKGLGFNFYKHPHIWEVYLDL